MTKYILFLLFLTSAGYCSTVLHTDYVGGGVFTAAGQNTNENAAVTAINGNIEGSTANSGGSAVNIKQGTISTPDIRDNVVTQDIPGNSNSSSTGGTIVKSVTITTAGYHVLLLASGNCTFGNTSSGYGLDIVRGSTGLAGGHCESQLNTNTGPGTDSCGVMTVDTPAAGTYTYNLYQSKVNACTENNVNLIVLEVRK